MPDLHPCDSLVELRGIGPVRSAALADAGLHTVFDLLLHLPFRYEDRRQRTRISAIDGEGRAMLRGCLRELRRVRVRRRNLSLVRGWLEDGTGRLGVIWFNRPYILNQIEEGRAYALFGQIRRRTGGFELVNPTCEPEGSVYESGRIVPIYPSVGGLGPAVVRRLLRQVLDRVDLGEIIDPLPSSVRDRHRLPELREALRALHEPPDDVDVEALNRARTRAHARLSYGEFLELQVELILLRGYEIRKRKAHAYRLDDELRKVLLDVLPFRLTAAQRRVLEEIAADLGSPYPMLRLLQGDVGSGKTIVAALALVMALESGLQAALMAPTELLAEQHFRTVFRLLGERYRLALLTSSAEEAHRARQQVAEGTIQLVIGTHALIQERLEFRRLGLAVVDEQHRFGVAQRQLLQRKGHRPDMLVMTATPIPRSLALTLYGDLALSVIDELPPGRAPVATRVVPSQQRRRAYDWLRRHLESGAQAYVVFPLIEDSERLEAESIASMGDRVRRYLDDHSSAILHGRTPSEERESVMRRFLSGELRVLIATTVIEVGLDVANASAMVIESAERFGLSQLHQLRGRIGRGQRRSQCIALHGRLTDEARRRLTVFAETDDGFRIAEADLEIRGPGDLLGTRQSGLPLFRVADIIRDRRWLERARRDALELIEGKIDGECAAYVETLRERARNRYQRFAGG